MKYLIQKNLSINQLRNIDNIQIAERSNWLCSDCHWTASPAVRARGSAGEVVWHTGGPCDKWALISGYRVIRLKPQWVSYNT